MKKKIWHKMKDEVPYTDRFCLIVLKGYSGALRGRCFAAGKVMIWYDDWGSPWDSGVVKKWAYISDILDIDEEEDNE